MCSNCKIPIYIKIIQYTKGLFAPATPEQKLIQKVEDMIGESYFKIDKKYCLFCGKKIDLE